MRVLDITETKKKGDGIEKTLEWIVGDLLRRSKKRMCLVYKDEEENMTGKNSSVKD